MRPVGQDTKPLNWIKKIAVILLALVGVALIGAWLILSSSLLAKPRGDMTARFLSEKLGQTVEIEGGVSIGLGTTLRVSADQLVLPGAPGATEGLAEIGQLSFDVAVRDLLDKNVKLSKLKVDGTKLRLTVAEDGTTSWSFLSQKDTKPAAKPDDSSQNAGLDQGEKLLDFFTDHRVEFTNSELSFLDAQNGWDIDFVLASFVVSQEQGPSAPVTLKGNGNVNGQDLTITGNFPEKQPFDAAIEFSDFSIKLDGTPGDAPQSTDFTSNLVVDITDLGQVQDILKLKKSAFGTAQAKAVLARKDGVTTLSDVDALIAFSGGQSVLLEGSLGDLRRKDDTVMRTNVQLYNKETMPPRAKIRQDLKLTGVDMTIDMVPGETIQRSMIIETNGFDINTFGEGPPPITVSEISRTQDGLLRIGKAELRLGKADAPFLILDGTIDDTLKLEQIDLGATLDLPMSDLVAPEYLKSAEGLGQVKGSFNLQGTAKVLALTDLKAASTKTDLWNLTVTGSVQNALKFENVNLDVAVDVPSGADLMKALELDPVDAGKVALETKISSKGRVWNSAASVSVGESDLNIDTNFDLGDPHPVLRGSIESDLINIPDLREIIGSAAELGRLQGLEKKARGDDPAASDDPELPELQPLVLNKVEVQPLVLDKNGSTDETAPGDASQEAGIVNVSLTPIGQAILFSGLEVDVTVDLKKIQGDKDVTSLQTDLVMKDNNAKVGPVKFEYAGADIDVTGALDLDQKDSSLNVKGTANGWDFADIMRELKFKKYASGTVNVNFDISGSHESGKEFMRTMSGNANVSMRNGSIQSQLLDIAGLGVIPWLFSKNKQKNAPIVCVRAPLVMNNGAISTKQTVVETDEVQLVMFGDVNLANGTMDISGQPRRIGKPLSKSPWPFTAVGSINKPKIKVKDGPRRLKRSDGKDKMPAQRKKCVPDILQLQ